MKKEAYQVAIIGGGPAGSSCALALANLGVQDIVLVESKGHEQFRIGESIPPESKPLFQQLDIWDAFWNEKHDPCYGSCSYWGSEKRGYNDFLLSPYGHGWHLDRKRFNNFLLQQATNRGVELLSNTVYKSSSKLPTGGFELVLEQEKQFPKTLKANLVVDATGTRALFASQQGSKKEQGIPLICLAATFKIETNLENISKLTHLEASPYGWWYAAQLPQQQFLVGLYTDADTIKQYRLQQLETWQALLKETQAIHTLVKDCALQVATFKGYPAPSFCLNEIVGKNWMAIGDAASAYDPITSQGIMKSMSNGLLAARVLYQKIQRPKNRLIDFHFIVKEQYQQYLNMRTHYYQRENRWDNMPFWKKMHSVVDEPVKKY